jgi:protein-tyrosine phosphatase
MGRRARVIADALGAESSLHRAAQISEDAIRRADLVLVASAQQRDDVLGQVPGALHSTFTIREAGRFAASLPEASAPDSVEQLRSRVEAITQGRGSGERGDDDIVDPQGKDDEAYRRMVRQEVPALARLAHALFGMPPAEVRAYDAAAEAGEFSFAKGAASGEVDAAYPPDGRTGVAMATDAATGAPSTRRRGRREA